MSSKFMRSSGTAGGISTAILALVAIGCGGSAVTSEDYGSREIPADIVTTMKFVGTVDERLPHDLPGIVYLPDTEEGELKPPRIWLRGRELVVSENILRVVIGSYDGQRVACFGWHSVNSLIVVELTDENTVRVLRTESPDALIFGLWRGQGAIFFCNWYSCQTWDEEGGWRKEDDATYQALGSVDALADLVPEHVSRSAKALWKQSPQTESLRTRATDYYWGGPQAWKRVLIGGSGYARWLDYAWADERPMLSDHRSIDGAERWLLATPEGPVFVRDVLPDDRMNDVSALQIPSGLIINSVRFSPDGQYVIASLWRMQADLTVPRPMGDHWVPGTFELYYVRIGNATWVPMGINGPQFAVMNPPRDP